MVVVRGIQVIKTTLRRMASQELASSAVKLATGPGKLGHSLLIWSPSFNISCTASVPTSPTATRTDVSVRHRMDAAAMSRPATYLLE
jgi:3-methyladenine DNA glycosylase Mpg